MTKVSSVRPQDIRNVVLLGHGGSGKTTLAEAVLHRCGVITRMGSIDEANTTSDFEPEARAHLHSTNSTLLFANHQGREINFIDTPGHPDFIGYALAALPAVETAILVVNASTGVEFNTRRLFHAAGEMGLARMIVINKIDANLEGLPGLVRELRTAFGAELHCINLPSKKGTDVIDCFDHEAGDADFGKVADIHQEILESTVEIDDDKLAKYLAGEKIDLTELRRCFVKAMNMGHVVPVVFASAKNEVGIDDLLHIVLEEAPSPLDGPAHKMRKGSSLVEVPCDPEKAFLAQVLKVTSDAYLGQLAMVRILQGRLDGNTGFVCGADKRVRKAGHILKVEGRDHPELESVAWAGDLVALAKIEDIHVNQILHDPSAPNDLEPVLPTFPTPMSSLAIEVKNRNDEVKLGQALQRLRDEDPTFRAEHDQSTNELVISGIGELHLRVMLEKLKNRFNLTLSSKEPTIAYRETITAKAAGHHRHKKQTGGAGQFGEVFLRIEPKPRGSGCEFASEVVGGTIPTQFISSVEKGVQDALAAGNLAGFPVLDVRVVVYDGKAHSVDSKDIAFRTAGKFAMRDALDKARPVLLEPIVTLEILAPEQYTGEITGHLKVHRGRVMGMDSQGAGMSVVHAQAPLAELGQFSNQLRSFTAGQGKYVMEFAHYDVVPTNIQQRVSTERGPRKKEEDE